MFLGDDGGALLRASVAAKLRAKLRYSIGRAFSPWSTPSPRTHDQPIRAELFSIERLEQHAESLATAQRSTSKPTTDRRLEKRLRDNDRALRAAYRATIAAVREERTVTPALDWLVDNFHVVGEQVRKIRIDLPPGFHRRLPKLVDGPLEGYPRVFGLAWAFVAHTDSRFDPQMLCKFVCAYQRVQPLTIGELWAVAITLRVVLVENLRRLAEDAVNWQSSRHEANTLADRLLGVGSREAEPADTVLGCLEGPLSTAFAVQLLQRLREQDSKVIPALRWLDERLAAHGTTADNVVHEEQQRQGAATVTIRNIITSMRLMSAIDWRELFESISLVDAMLRAESDFAALDFTTRDLYRRAIEELARGSSLSEIEVARLALLAAKRAGDEVQNEDDTTLSRKKDPGYYLIAKGRPAFEKAIGFHFTIGGWLVRANATVGIFGYLGIVAIITAIIAALILNWVTVPGGSWAFCVLALLALIPASDAAMALVNCGATNRFEAITLPSLELSDGVPSSLRTMIVVPTLLTSRAAIAEQIERLEVHHLANSDGDLCFAMLSDWTDSPTESAPGDDELLGAAVEGIADLNRRYGPAPGGDRFLFLHRRRLWNDSQRKWIGWERKRGKLHEFNRLLRGATDTTFVSTAGRPPVVSAGVRYVIILDADTRLPRGAAKQLIGKMAHPLNRPTLDLHSSRVIDGYAVLQPRVTPSLPTGREGSLFQRVFSNTSGMDSYACAVSDVYQDLFGEGSYCGKGIYDVDLFEAALAGRIPENTLLSHDLLEGIFARTGLVSDIEVIDEFPARYDVAVARQYRWARGDWQLLPWILGRRSTSNGDRRHRAIPLVGRWKMIDNLRRSLSAPASFLALVGGWTLPFASAELWSAFILTTIAIPALLPFITGIVPRRLGLSKRIHLWSVGVDLKLALSQIVLLVTLLAHQAWVMSDAIVRTLFRLTVSRRNLLEWVTAAQAKVSPQLDLIGFYRQMAGAVALAVGAAVFVAWAEPNSWPVALPFVGLWLLSPAVARWTSLPAPVSILPPVSAVDAQSLRLIARRTWRFFETFVTVEDHMLPPDNFQEEPMPVVAHRTSPTNLGLYLLSVAAARDFGWIGMIETAERLEATLQTMDGLLTQLLGAMPTLADLPDLCDAAISILTRQRLKLAGRPNTGGNNHPQLDALIDGFKRSAQAAAAFKGRLVALGELARTMFEAMAFGFLFDPEREFFSIGYRIEDESLDPNYYDLLASEARLVSFVAIAKGDVPTRHWFRLGRAMAPVGYGSALISWSGSMFEYLMPSLVMRAPVGSLLEQTSRQVVRQQMKYGAKLGVPWGASESAYNARDLELTYQYSSFGVPDLALKWGIGDNTVIAPYATALATMVDPQAAARNFVRLAEVGGRGRYGWYEALDYTKGRLPEGTDVAVVRAYMAHHQGMSVVAIADALHDGAMRRRFHAERIIQATELLLHERMPHDVALSEPMTEVQGTPRIGELVSSTQRRFNSPRTHLLSNGRYAVMITAAGSGYSRWRDTAVTRWQEDVTCDHWGTYVFLRDTRSGEVWSAGYQPSGAEPDRYQVAFSEGRAEIVRHDGTITTTLEVAVSSEDDAEVRRVSITNLGSATREIELTSYAEIVLAPRAADDAHPAFSKLFVETEFVAKCGRHFGHATDTIARRLSSVGSTPRCRRRQDYWRCAVRD
jgi:hypothetical protein